MASVPIDMTSATDPEVAVTPSGAVAIDLSQADSVGSYKGYKPTTAAQLTQAAPITKPAIITVEPPLEEDAPVDRPKLPLGVGVMFVVAAILSLVFALTPVSCSLGLCEQRDGSTHASSAYVFTPLPFSSPLVLILVTLSLAFLGMAVMALLIYLNSPYGPLIPPVTTFATHVRKRAHSLTVTSSLAAYAIIIPVFIAIGIVARWKTAAAFLLGSVPVVLSAFLSLSSATRASVKAAISIINQRETPLSIFAHATRAASITPLSSHALTFAFQVLTYLVLRDVNTLTAFVFGAALTAFTIRVASTIFTPASRATVYRIPLVGDVRSPAADISTRTATAAAHAAEACVLFAAPTAATAVLGAGVFPYFEDNEYAMCVWNHLNVDIDCMRYTDTFDKISFAVNLCKRDNFFSQGGYPGLTGRQSNMLFVALPFLLCVQILISMLSSVALSYRAQRDAASRLDRAVEGAQSHVGDHVEDGGQRGDRDEATGGSKSAKLGSKDNLVRPFLKAFLVDQAMRFLVSTLGFVVILVLLLGPPSTFNKANSVELSRYSLPSVDPSVLQADICRPVDAPNSGLPSGSFPRLEFLANATYRPIDVYGSSLPNISNLPWLLLACLILGLACSVSVGIISAYTSSPPSTYSVELLRDGFDGEVPLANSGSLVGTVLCLTIVVITLLSSHHILRGYGVAMAAMGALTSLAPSSAACLAAQIARDAHDLVNASTQERKGKSTSIILGAGAGNSSIIGWSKGVSTSIMILSAASFLFVAVLHTGIFPSSSEIVGTSVNSDPTRHIADTGAGPSADILDIDVLSGVLFGFVIPYVIACASVAGAAVVASSVLSTAARREMIKRGWWSWDDLLYANGYDECGFIANRTAGWASMGPVLMAVISAVGGLWADRANWIGVAIGCVCGGSVAAFVLALVGGRLDDLSITKRAEQDLNSEFESTHNNMANNAHSRLNTTNTAEDGESHWAPDDMAEEWLSSCVRLFVLLFTTGSVVSSETVRGNAGSSWWWMWLLLLLWVVVTGLTHFALRRLAKKLKRDAVFKVDDSHSRVNANVVSGVSVPGPSVRLNQMANDSMLRQLASLDGRELKPILY